MTTTEKVQRAIEELIDSFATDLNDADFIEALEEMEERAKTAREARQEELDDPVR